MFVFLSVPGTVFNPKCRCEVSFLRKSIKLISPKTTTHEEELLQANCGFINESVFSNFFHVLSYHIQR